MYNLYVNGKPVGQGLSFGELNQWLIDLDKELNEVDRIEFRKDLGFEYEVNQDNFEDYLYNNHINAPLTIRFGDKLINITKE